MQVSWGTQVWVSETHHSIWAQRWRAPAVAIGCSSRCPGMVGQNPYSGPRGQGAEYQQFSLRWCQVKAMIQDPGNRTKSCNRTAQWWQVSAMTSDSQSGPKSSSCRSTAQWCWIRAVTGNSRGRAQRAAAAPVHRGWGVVVSQMQRTESGVLGQVSQQQQPSPHEET